MTAEPRLEHAMTAYCMCIKCIPGVGLPYFQFRKMEILLCHIPYYSSACDFVEEKKIYNVVVTSTNQCVVDTAQF